MNNSRKKVLIGLSLISFIVIFLTIYKYPYYPKLLSKEWFESRYKGWDVERYDLWVGSIQQVIDGRTIIIRDTNGIDKTMTLIYISPKTPQHTQQAHIEYLKSYQFKNLYVKGNPDKKIFSGVLLDRKGVNLNFDMLYQKGAVIDMSSTAYVFDRKKQLIPYLANINSIDRKY